MTGKKRRKGGLAIESMGLLVLMIVTIAIILFAFIHYFMKGQLTIDKSSNGVSKDIISVINGISKSIKEGKGFTLIPNTTKTESSPTSSTSPTSSEDSSSSSTSTTSETS